MTAIRVHELDEASENAVGAWRCESCSCIHVRAGGVLLTFAASEYDSFAQAVADCYWEKELRAAATGPTPLEEAIH